MNTTNAVTQAVETLTGRKGPKAPTPRNTRAVKDQTPTVKIDWETAAVRVKAAVTAQDGANAKWISAADTLWILGVRPQHFEEVREGEKITRTAEYLKVRGLVVASYSEKIQKLLALKGTMQLMTLSETDRHVLSQSKAKVERHIATIRSHLMKHEKELAEPGAQHRVTFEASLIKTIKAIKDRIKRADPEKIKFDDVRVIELLDEAIAELS